MSTIWQSWFSFAVAVLVVVAAVFVVSAVVSLIVRAIARHREWAAILIDRVRWPFRVFLLVAGLWMAVAVAFPEQEWRAEVDHAFLIALIVAGAWLVAQGFLFLTDLGMRRYRVDVADNRLARRARTQLQIVRRLVVVVIVILAFGIILFTFDAVRALGASVLASAGIVSIVAGLAAQSVLGNLFAGVQLAFSDAIRVDDVVIVEGEWGRIEEITLNYVVVGLWDDRRLVLPCTYFTTKPFQNWTRTSSQLLGSVELDLDWRVSPAAMREHLDAILERTELWDGRAKVLQVTDAVGGFVRVRILVTAVDAPTLFDLRCFVREEMVHWIQRVQPDAQPAQRVLLAAGAGPVGSPEAETAVPEGARGGARGARDRHEAGDGDRSGLFTGTPEAEERAQQFTQAIPIVRREAGEESGTPGDEAPGHNGMPASRRGTPKPPEQVSTMAAMTLIAGYDPDTLRERVDPVAVAARLAELGELRSRDALCERAWLYKVAGRVTEALDQANQALRLARFTGERRDIQQPRMLRATVLQANGELDAAAAELSACIEEAHTHDWHLLEASGRQHRGKVWFAQGEFQDALADFAAALELRTAHGASADQVESTRFAIEATLDAAERAGIDAVAEADTGEVAEPSGRPTPESTRRPGPDAARRAEPARSEASHPPPLWD
ncbi:mechanosensitive ion channel domain-containing protein [Agromyces sp. MMS24-K17]|uniref:mechanosensitive ion channel domain-containing protein n=1 Tax=Agromyces sp. MMS24-K17 TaxID=3372850 RepID=UPI0037550578